MGLPIFLATGTTWSATYTVSKDGRGAFSTITEAVSKAKNGDEILILDAAVYPEQVTLDSTKSGLTIRSSNPTALVKPTIKWTDTQHQNPKSCQDALTPNKIDFDQNGALRLLRVRGVTIDGIGIDAGTPTPFTWPNVWGDGVTCNGQLFPLFHGNGGIALYIAGGVTIRNCDISNAFYGIAVKDRNEGGVFANVNPADLEKSNVVPLSGFGKTGHHVFENNRIHNNAWGFFFESSWDLGSIARYNLIYENHHATPAAAAAVKAMEPDGQHHPGGGFLFKDAMLSPLAIYNNTFWHNYTIFAGGYRPGAPHLIFNNIYAQPYEYLSENVSFPNPFHILDPFFKNRMWHSLYAAQTERPKLDSQKVQAQKPDPGTNQQVLKDTTVKFYRSVRIMNGMGNVAQENFTVNVTLPLSTGDEIVPLTIQGANLPGGLIGGATEAFPAAANVRWYEIKFLSTDPKNPDFLSPDWDDPIVQKYVMNAGWPAAGIYNLDGKVADIGAIPSSSRHEDNVLIRPLSPVIINGTTATLNFDLTAIAGGLQNPKIKYIKLVRSIPVLLTGFGGMPTLVVPPPVDVTPSTTALKMGGNTITVTGFQPFAATEKYAFFEIIAEGTASNGQLATTSVGFLPYRTLDYKFLVEVLDETGKKVTSIKAGVPAKLKITPQSVGGSPFSNPISPVEISLNSGADLLNTANPPAKLTVPNITGATALDIQFTRVPTGSVEYVTAAGIWKSGTQTLAFYGVSDGITILPGDPEKILFQDPPSKILTPGAAPVLDPGILYPVKVQVRDKFDNNIATPIEVTIKSNNPTIGDIDGAKTAMTDENGIASFNAKVTTGDVDQIFELEASIPGKPADKADLKVGKPRDKLWILYGDAATGYDAAVELRGNAGDRLPVTIRASTDGLTTVTERTNEFTLSMTSGIAVYATPADVAPATTFKLVAGELVVYVTGLKVVNNGSLTATPVNDGTILGETRGKIFFAVAGKSVKSTQVFADNGFGAVNRIEMFFGEDLAQVPDSLEIAWPILGQNTKKVSTGFTLDPADKKHVTVLLSTPFPANITAGGGTLGSVFLSDPAAPEEPTQKLSLNVDEKVGPLIDSGRVYEKLLTPGVDTLTLGFTEKLTAGSLLGKTLLLIKGGEPPISMNVKAAADLGDGLHYKLVIEDLGQASPQAGDSVRFDPTGPAADALGNKTQAENRPIALGLKTVPRPPVLKPDFDPPYSTVNLPVGLPPFLVLTANPGGPWQPILGGGQNGLITCSGMQCGGEIADQDGKIDRPAINVVTDRGFRFSVAIFSNTGEFLDRFEGEITNAELGLDERGVSNGGPSKFARVNGNFVIKIAWNAFTKDGRKAGTGAYIARYQVSVQRELENGTFTNFAERKDLRFGLIRGN